MVLVETINYVFSFQCSYTAFVTSKNRLFTFRIHLQNSYSGSSYAQNVYGVYCGLWLKYGPELLLTLQFLYKMLWVYLYSF